MSPKKLLTYLLLYGPIAACPILLFTYGSLAKWGPLETIPGWVVIVSVFGGIGWSVLLQCLSIWKQPTYQE